MFVRLGRFNLSSDNEIGSLKREIERIDLNPDWNKDSEKYDSDIAILFMTVGVPFSNLIKPVCLPIGENIENIHAGTVVRRFY